MAQMSLNTENSPSTNGIKHVIDGGSISVRPTGMNGVSTNGYSMLQPGRLIRPMISEQVATQLVRQLYGLTVNSVKELNSYYDRNFFVTVEDVHYNPFIEAIWPHGYVLKVINTVESCTNHIEAEHEMQALLDKNSISCPQLVLNIGGQDKSLENIVYDLPNDISSTDAAESEIDVDGRRSGTRGRGIHVVRLLTFVPGRVLAEAPYSERLLYRVGRYVASVENILQDFHHPSLNYHKNIWNLDNIPDLLLFTWAIQDPENRRIIEEVIDAFMRKVVPNKGKFQKGVIHGDFNEQNILVKEVPFIRSPSSCLMDCNSNSITDFDVCGILDFAHASNSFYLYEVAIVIMYTMLDSKIVDPLDVGGHILGGYSSLKGRSLNQAEFEALRVCVAGRFAQSLTVGAYTYSLNPTNEYLLTSSKNGWKQLKRFWNTAEENQYERWKSIMTKWMKEPDELNQ